MTVVAPATRYNQTSVKLPDESESWHEPLLGENSDEVLAMVGFTANEEKLQVQMAQYRHRQVRMQKLKSSL